MEMTGGTEGRADLLCGMIQICRIRVRLGVGDVEIVHVPHRHEVPVQVGNLQAGDHHPYLRGREGRVQRPAQITSHGREVGDEPRFGIDPMIDLVPRDDERVARGQRVDRQERDATVVLPHETCRQVAVDDRSW